MDHQNALTALNMYLSYRKPSAFPVQFKHTEKDVYDYTSGLYRAVYEELFRTGKCTLIEYLIDSNRGNLYPTLVYHVIERALFHVTRNEPMYLGEFGEMLFENSPHLRDRIKYFQSNIKYEEAFLPPMISKLRGNYQKYSESFRLRPEPQSRENAELNRPNQRSEEDLDLRMPDAVKSRQETAPDFSIPRQNPSNDVNAGEPANPSTQNRDDAQRILADAKRSAEQIRATASADADRIRTDASTEAARIRADAIAEAARIREQAKSDADGVIAQAKKKAEDNAQAEVQRLVQQNLKAHFSNQRQQFQKEHDEEMKTFRAISSDIPRLKEEASSYNTTVQAQWDRALETMQQELNKCRSDLVAQMQDWRRSLYKAEYGGVVSAYSMVNALVNRFELDAAKAQTASTEDVKAMLLDHSTKMNNLMQRLQRGMENLGLRLFTPEEGEDFNSYRHTTNDDDGDEQFEERLIAACKTPGVERVINSNETEVLLRATVELLPEDASASFHNNGFYSN